MDHSCLENVLAGVSLPSREVRRGSCPEEPTVQLIFTSKQPLYLCVRGPLVSAHSASQ